MSVIHPLLDNRKGLLLYLAVWLLLGVALALPALGLEAGQWRFALGAFLPPFMIFSALCLTAWYPCRANPLSDTSALRLLAVHLSAAAVSALLWLGLARMWADVLRSWLEVAVPVATQPSRFLALGMLFYLLGTSLHYLMLAYDESVQAQERAFELRVLAREAELAAYKSQIDPHFLFNCLNSISSLCGSRPAEARRMTILLGDFLRTSLRLADRDHITMAEELELAQGYLDIERIRFGDRLTVRDELDEAVADFPVPPLLLQPLLENAIKHGLAHLIDGGDVRLAATLRDGRARIEISNPVDPDGPVSDGEGIGLDNVIGRLELLYQGRAQLEIDRSHDRFRVTIELPRRGRGAEARE